MKCEPFRPFFVPLHKRDDYERIRMESKMEMGDYRIDSPSGDGIVYASLKIIGDFQCFFRIKPFLCTKKRLLL